MEPPLLYGIRKTNREQSELCTKRNFPTSITVALANYMRDSGIPANLVTYKDRRIDISAISIEEVYQCNDVPNEELLFLFDAVSPYTDYASGLRQSDLVVVSPSSQRPLQIMSSVVPDASTIALNPSKTGPEMTLRTSDLEHCAISIARSFEDDMEELESLTDLDGITPDWNDWDEMSAIVPDIITALNIIESECRRQKPILMQAIWRTEGQGIIMSESAMDLFVWSDFALTRLFLDGSVRFGLDKPSRPIRCILKMFRIIKEIAVYRTTDCSKIQEIMGYGISNAKELMVNGKLTNRVMACPRLEKPIIFRNELEKLVPRGFEDMVLPERKLDISMYYSICLNKNRLKLFVRIVRVPSIEQLPF